VETNSSINTSSAHHQRQLHSYFSTNFHTSRYFSTDANRSTPATSSALPLHQLQPYFCTNTNCSLNPSTNTNSSPFSAT
jgi:hypothetical protein